MHETSLGQTVRDFLTGENVEETTYEDLRQALARMLVEEKGYPRERLRPKVPVPYGDREGEGKGDGDQQARQVDIVAFDEEGRPLLLVFFCSGEIGSYRRETVAAARLIPEGPAPLVLVTDTKDAVLMDAATGGVKGEGIRAIPDWERAQRLAGENPCPPLDERRRGIESRILKTYSGFLTGCCGGSCKVE